MGVNTQKKGRPATHFSDSLRVSYWSNRILISSGQEDIPALESLLRDRCDVSLASGLFGRYLRGESVPQGALSGSNDTLIHRLEAFFPGSAEAFFNPAWDLLVWSPAIDLTEMRSLYVELEDEVKVHFVRHIRSRYGREPIPEQGFWYIPKATATLKSTIEAAPANARLVLALLEARMAYASQRHEAFVIAQTSACQILAQLQSENTSAVARRQVGVLLTMEALCLDALLITTFGSEYGRSEVGSLSSKAGDFYRAWKYRCIVYAKGLPKAAKAQFESMISSETEIGKQGYSPFQQAA